METPFRPKSEPHQLAEEIRRRIDAGEYAGRLPGIRRLMERFGVTRTCVEAALGQLESAGVLTLAGGRRAPEVVAGGAGAPREGTVVLHADPLERRTGDHREILLALEAALPGPVLRLSLPAGDDMAGRVVERVLETGCRRVVAMDHAPAVVAALARAGRVVVAAGTTGDTGTASQVAVSHELLVRGALRKAFEAGHRRVSFPLWRRRPEVAASVRAWMADEYARHGYSHSPRFDAPEAEGRDPQALHRTLRELLRHTPPTALVASDFAQWLGTVGVLGEAGLRLPRDMSLLCLCSAPEWESATPTPAHFRLPVRELAEAVAEALAAAERGAPPRRQMIAPEWVPGRSLGPPR